LLEQKATGALVGSAVGDAIGGAVEGWTPEAIRERSRRLGHRHRRSVVRPTGGTARPIAPYHKGDGHITDDTLMTHAWSRCTTNAGPT
jgi:ADP-ribosylglycohydrolase